MGKIKKQGILNSQIAKVLANMGHTDTICIGDCGLPIPQTTERIDVSLSKGTPSLIQVVSVIAEDMTVEKITLASEIKDKNHNIDEEVKIIFPNVMVEYVSHNELKAMTEKCKAVVRTGEITPYANIILHSGIIF